MILLRIFFTCAVFICITSQTRAYDKYKVVETSNGQVRGLRNTTLLKNVQFYSFKGIPYAKPPIGDLRFKAPEPIESWTPKILDAFEYGDMCTQPSKLWPVPFSQSEDCLTLNIYVPAEVKPNGKLAVLFFIHGGGFIDGSYHDSVFGPDFLLEKETILVTIQYRLGALGFLSLNTPEYSGNMGLKDQQLALKWISKNIGRFGGDNQRITIFGHSAGGVCINYHVLSAESRKYFRNAIPMSGSVFNYWALSSEKNHLELVHRILEELGEQMNSFDELLTFLRTAPAELFNKFSKLELEKNVRFRVPFGPIVERMDAERPFIARSPEKLYETSKIDVDAMFTVTNLEAMSLIPKTPAAFLNELNSNFNLPLPFRGIDKPIESDVHHSLMNQIRQFYFGDGNIDEQSIPTFFEYLSDLNFVLGIDKSAKMQATHTTSKTYYLWFSVDSTLNMFKKLGIFPRGDFFELPGAAHADDLCYLFRCGIAQSYYEQIIKNQCDDQSKISLQTIDYITKLYTNFAKYGKPVHQKDPSDRFEPIQNDDIHFLDINNDGLTTGLKPHQKVIDFWSNIEKQAQRAIQQKRDEL